MQILHEVWTGSQLLTISGHIYYQHMHRLINGITLIVVDSTRKEKGNRHPRLQPSGLDSDGTPSLPTSHVARL